MISITGYGSGGGAGSGSSITAWATSVEYEVGDVVIYNESLYRCNTAHTSGTFSTDIVKWTLLYSDLKYWSASTYYTVGVVVINSGKIYKCITTHTSDSSDFFADITNWELVGGGNLEEWEANTNYKDGDILVYDGQIYQAKIDFTSSLTFDKEKLLDEYTLVGGETPIAWATGTSISTNDIVSYNGNYYKALTNFICGQDFSEYALDEYVPKPLTQQQIEDIIRNFNPVQSGSTGFVVQNSAPAHNALYRGKDLTDYWNSGEMSIAIANGSFENIFPGDYVIKSVTVNGTTYADTVWIVGDCDYFYNNGDTACTTHHVLMFPEVCIGTSYMNSSNTSSGGYVGSFMWTTRIPQYVTGIQNAFGSSHVLSHRELLTTSMDTNGKSSAYCTWGGAANNWAWKDVLVNIFNENMVYGSAQGSSSMYDTGDGNHQIAAMRHNRQIMFTRSNWYCLRSVGASTGFVSCMSSGNVTSSIASDVGGLRPYFLLT